MQLLRITPLLDSTQNARLVCISHLRPAVSRIGAVAQLGERMTGSPQPTVLLINQLNSCSQRGIWAISRFVTVLVQRDGWYQFSPATIWPQ
jgi:hypothetical protein